MPLLLPDSEKFPMAVWSRPSKLQCISLWQSSGYVVQFVKFDGTTSATKLLRLPVTDICQCICVDLCMQTFRGLRRSFVLIVFLHEFRSKWLFQEYTEAAFFNFSWSKCILLKLMCNENQITNRIAKLSRVTCCFIWFSLHINSSKMHILQEKLKNAASVYSWNNHLLRNSCKNYAVNHGTSAYTNQHKCTDIYRWQEDLTIW